MLEVGRQDDGLVTSFAGELDTQVPGVESDEGEIEVLRREVFRRKGVETIDGIAEGPSIANVFPGQGRQARWGGGERVSAGAALKASQVGW